MRTSAIPLPLLASVLLSLGVSAGGSGDAVVFESFEYAGQDAQPPLPAGSYRNPILPGFHPDPSICRVGEDYYLVTSSFAWHPGVPIFHSRDLVHWRQIGHVLTRPSQMKLDGLGVSRGVFAPTLRHHAGTFYMITTLVDGGGNFYVTAKDPAGPWSDPIWLPEIDGIDPSFFFDEDGRAYVINNGPPEGQPLYDGHRALWIQELDLAAARLTGPRQVIVNGGVDLARRPIWIEGPHILKKDGWYVLIAAEGGTAEDHSEVVFRSRSVRGPYVPWERNPILTQRTLDPNRPDAVTSTGHADFVDTPDGNWWAVFLGCRPYEEGRFYNTGRETFLLPVRWADGWPMVLAPGLPVPLVAPAPALAAAADPATPASGSFTWRDEFERPALDLAWNTLRAAPSDWARLERGALHLNPRAASLGSRETPSFVARRQQHLRFTATAAVALPSEPGRSGGIVAFQNETHHFYMGVRREGASAVVFLERAVGKEAGGKAQTVARQPLPDTAASAGQLVWLRIEGRGREHVFSFAPASGAPGAGAAAAPQRDAWRKLASEDGRILSTAVAGGFVGTYVGLHARLEP